jgi:hypothetical protein
MNIMGTRDDLRLYDELTTVLEKLATILELSDYVGQDAKFEHTLTELHNSPAGQLILQHDRTLLLSTLSLLMDYVDDAYELLQEWWNEPARADHQPALD